LPTTVGLRMTSDRFEEIKARVLAYKKNEPISPKVPTEKRTLK